MALVEVYKKYTSLGKFVAAASLLLFAACGSLDNSDLSGDADSRELVDSKKVSEIHFDDSNLKACIDWEVETKNIDYVFEFQTLSCVGPDGDDEKKIGNLSGIEHFTGLLYLKLNKNKITDISPLSNLIKIIELDLSDNNIDNISPLSNLTKIIELDLSDNSNLKKINALSNMKNLTVFYSENTAIDDLTPLIESENIVELGLEGNNQIVSFDPLSNLLKINQVNLGLSGFKDIFLLQNLPELKWLWLYGNDIDDLSDFQNFPENEHGEKILTLLSLNNNKIQSMCDLKDLTNLTGLDLSHNDISTDVLTEVTCLETLTNITENYGLNLSYNDGIQCSHINDLMSAIGDGKVVGDGCIE